MIIDVSSYSVVTDMEAHVIDDWLHDNVGPLISDSDGELQCDSSGNGWRLYWNGEARRWFLDITDDSKMTLFILRWS